MNVVVEVDKRSMAKLEATFKNMVNGVVSAQAPLKESAEIVRDESVRNFKDQGYTYGTAWKPLTSRTRRDRARKGYSPARPILVRRGTLRDGARVTSVTSSQSIVRNPVDYAKYHQFGTKNMVQRVVLTATDKIKHAISLVFVNYINRLISK